MTTFANAVDNQTARILAAARTTNGMKARASTADSCTDLFFQIGAMRGKNIVPAFVAAYVQNPELATRIALWARDARGGAGERKIFRDILGYLSQNNQEFATRVARKLPELGRWDDVFALSGESRQVGFELVREALAKDNALAAKWMPRKGKGAAELRSYLGMTPKQYRKTLVNLTKVVETQMCAKDWDNINFNHVPSVASARYKKAFGRHTTKYADWVQKLVKGDPTAKVNAGAVYPYDVLKGLVSHRVNMNYDKTQLDHINAQWNALPNYVGDANILPVVDVSGSMTTSYSSNKNLGTLTPLDVAVSLGLYLADKNMGVFKDVFLTFSERPELLHLWGNILDKINQMVRSKWGMSTNLHIAIEKILATAIDGQVSPDEMPKMLLILSDMQFNMCVRYDDSAIEMIRRKYDRAGYNMPHIVFWNLNAHDNTPVKFNERGVALVSGFSPSIVKSILSGDMEQFTPEAIMLKAVMQDRYAF